MIIIIIVNCSGAGQSQHFLNCLFDGDDGERGRKSKTPNHHRWEQTNIQIKREENTGHYVVKIEFMKAMNSQGIHKKVLFTFNRSFCHY